jgi:hypothetical protein
VAGYACVLRQSSNSWQSVVSVPSVVFEFSVMIKAANRNGECQKQVSVLLLLD